MYSMDGVALANPALGWRFKLGSEPWVSRGIDRPDFNASNRDGTTAVRGHITTPTMTVVATAPGTTVEQLRRLLRLGTSLTRTDTPGTVLGVQIVTLTHETLTPAGDGLHKLTAVYRIPGVWWRDAATTDWSSVIPTSAGPGSATMTVLPTSSGSVQDALIGLRGDALNLRIAGRNGTYVQLDGRWSTGPNGSIMQARIDTVKGRAWSMAANSDLWSGGVEITSQVETGAFPYFLELFPTSTALGCTVTLSWDAIYTATTVTVRAAQAYDR